MIQAQNMRQIKLRIKSIGNTRKITKAMEMVSASKMNKVKGPFFQTKPYMAALETMLHDLIADSPELKNNLIEKREDVRNIALCVFTSDTGLCGAYNNNVMKAADHFLRERSSGVPVNIVAVGREGHNHFKKYGFNIINSYLGLYGRFSSTTCDDITNRLMSMFLLGEADEVYVAYSHFKPSLRHAPAVEKLLNIEAASRPRRYYSFEPSARVIFYSITAKYILYKMRAILLETFACEHSARMLAIKTATDNADELTSELTLARNKARQFAITKEVLEIAASAEALKG